MSFTRCPLIHEFDGCFYIARWNESSNQFSLDARWAKLEGTYVSSGYTRASAAYVSPDVYHSFDEALEAAAELWFVRYNDYCDPDKKRVDPWRLKA
jgi:hypothetical protein